MLLEALEGLGLGGEERVLFSRFFGGFLRFFVRNRNLVRIWKKRRRFFFPSSRCSIRLLRSAPILFATLSTALSLPGKLYYDVLSLQH